MDPSLLAILLALIAIVPTIAITLAGYFSSKRDREAAAQAALRAEQLKALAAEVDRRQTASMADQTNDLQVIKVATNGQADAMRAQIGTNTQMIATLGTRLTAIEDALSQLLAQGRKPRPRVRVRG